MKKIIYKLGAFAFALALISGVSVQSASAKAAKKTDIEVAFQLLDESGKPVKDASVIIGEGDQYIQSDKDGRIAVSMGASDIISVKEPGYEKVTFKIEDIKEGHVTLQSSLYMESFTDEVSLPYRKTSKRASTGDYVVITSEDLRHYPTHDIRNAISALAPGLIVTENNGAVGNYPGTTDNRVSLTNRGSAPMYYIDNILIDINDLNVVAEDVESITIIKDIVGKSMYGPRAAGGLVYIKTKRGKKNENVISVNVEKGISVVDRMPGVASGVDYATINNMARTNDGMRALYSEEAIEGYKENYPNDLEFPSTDFASLMFKDLRSFDKYSVSNQGGNDFVQYFANVGYQGEGDNFAMGDKANFHDITFRSNIDMKLNDIVSVEVGLYGDLKLRNSPSYGNGGLEYVSALGGARNTSPVAFPIYLPIETPVGNPVYGVSESFTVNPIAKLEGGGYHQERGRTGSVNAALNFNLDALTKGLSSKTYINLTTYNQTRIGKNNTFDSRLVDLSGGAPSYTIISNYEVRTGESKRSDFYYQYLYGYQQFNYDRTFGDHSVEAGAVFNVLQYSRKAIEDPYKEMNLNFSASYSYKNRYYLDVAVSHAGSMALKGENQFRTFPSVGAGWIISDEPFMKGVKAIDFLKLRGQFGQIGFISENPTLRQYENQWLKKPTANTFGPYEGSDVEWLGKYYNPTVGATYYDKWKNESLDWELRTEYSAGIDLVMLDNRLSISATYYNNLREGVWGYAENNYSMMSGMLAYPTENVESTRFYGAETYARFTDNIGALTYSIGASATFNRSKRIAYDEPNYSDQNKHLSRIGQSATAIYGYIYEGQFASDEDAQKVIQSNDPELKAGDFRYKDVNKDKVFDSNDAVVIGDTTPDVYYTLNLALGYKGFELNVVADGKAGYEMNTSTNTYFAGGWGDNNYSQYVVDRIFANDYPRTTYTKVNNNFLASEYWMMDRSYFKIQNIEFAYNLAPASFKKIGIRNVRLFVRGANLCTVSSLKGIDPESTSAGISAYALNKTVTGGFNLTF